MGIPIRIHPSARYLRSYAPNYKRRRRYVKETLYTFYPINDNCSHGRYVIGERDLGYNDGRSYRECVWYVGDVCSPWIDHN